MTTLSNNDPLFYKTNGDLTVYSFACGYIEREENNSKWKEMYREHNVYHVRAGRDGEKWAIWDSFERVTDAWKRYKSIKLITLTSNKGKILQSLTDELAN